MGNKVFVAGITLLLAVSVFIGDPLVVQFGAGITILGAILIWLDR